MPDANSRVATVVSSVSVQTRDLFDLSGRTALVTGGGRGIGRHLAIGLAEAGARVIVASRKLDACREVAEQIEAGGGEARALQADLSASAEIASLVSRIAADFPVVDVLVNDLHPSGVGVGSQGVELGLGVLVGGGDAGVEGETHKAGSFYGLGKTIWEVYALGNTKR